MRIAAGVEYRGTRFLGWQRQLPGPTVQECVEAALSDVANHPLQVHCAGRTDAGVHAWRQVIHFDTASEREPQAWILGGNVLLPEDVSLTWAKSVDSGFHARYSATGRTYQYLILNRRSRPGTWTGLVAWECRPLDCGRMAAAAADLVGEHDFSSFRAAECQAKSAVRDVRRLEVSRHGDLVLVEIEANAFLQHMVRNIVGVLTAIGMGKRAVEWAGEVLSQRDRTLGGVTAPADGLYLVDVAYPEHFEIPRLPLSGRVNGPCSVAGRMHPGAQ